MWQCLFTVKNHFFYAYLLSRTNYFYCVSQGSFYHWFRPRTMRLCQFYCQETAFFPFYIVFLNNLFIAGSNPVQCGTKWQCQFYCQEPTFFVAGSGHGAMWKCQFYSQEPTFLSMVRATVTVRCGNASFTLKNQPFYHWFGPQNDVAMPILLSRTNLFIAGSGHGAMWQCQFYCQEPTFLSLVPATYNVPVRCGAMPILLSRGPTMLSLIPATYDVAMPVLQPWNVIGELQWLVNDSMPGNYPYLSPGNYPLSGLDQSQQVLAASVGPTVRYACANATRRERVRGEGEGWGGEG